jgi:hypothetical protein
MRRSKPFAFIAFGEGDFAVFVEDSLKSHAAVLEFYKGKVPDT